MDIKVLSRQRFGIQSPARELFHHLFVCFCICWAFLGYFVHKAAKDTAAIIFNCLPLGSSLIFILLLVIFDSIEETNLYYCIKRNNIISRFNADSFVS